MTSFGWGQRTCLGQTLTQDELLIACGSICWAFDMAHKIDPATGKAIEIDTMKSNSLLIVKPDPWQMAPTPRSEAKKQTIIKMWKEADAAEEAAKAAFLKAGEMKSKA
jgi:hypothetical protein